MIVTVAETRSTNDDVAELARQGAVEGTWVRAERQTGGRGRQGRAWQSPVGNLYASTLVRLSPGDPPAPTLALVAGVAVQEVLAEQLPDQSVTLKWPNDLLVGGAKIAGILLERVGDAVVIGIGVNLAHHPDSLDRPAVSVAALNGVAPQAGDFADMLADRFARWLRRWRGEGLAPIRAQWLSAAHAVGTALSTGEGEGLFDGLAEDGALRLRRGDGSVTIIHAGDVFLV